MRPIAESEFQKATSLKLNVLGLLFNLLLTSTSAVFAQSASTNSISFQGALMGSNGQALPNGSYNLTFNFYTNGTTSTALGTTNINSVATSSGIVSAAIPVNPNWFNGQTLYLGVSVNAGAELTPRTLVTAVPYSLSTLGMTYSNGVVEIGTQTTQGWPNQGTLNVLQSGPATVSLSLVAGPLNAALAITESNSPDPGQWPNPMLLAMDGADSTGALHWGLLSPFGTNTGVNTAGSAAVMYWNGTALSLGSPDYGHTVFNVGIGTRTPQATLDVAGTVNAQTSVTTPSLTATSVNVGKINSSTPDYGDGTSTPSACNSVMTSLAVSNLYVTHIINWDNNQISVPQGGSCTEVPGLQSVQSEIRMSSVGEAGEALKSIEALKQKFEKMLSEKDADIQALKNQNALLDKRLSALEQAAQLPSQKK